MIKDLIRIANKLDQRGLTKEADLLDTLISRAGMFQKSDFDGDLDDDMDTGALKVGPSEGDEEMMEEDPTEEVVGGLTMAVSGLEKMMKAGGDTEVLQEMMDKLSGMINEFTGMESSEDSEDMDEDEDDDDDDDNEADEY